AADLLVGGRIAEGQRVFLGVRQRIDPTGVNLGYPIARDQRGRRQRFARIQRAPHDLHLVPARELRRAVDRLGRIALRIADDELDLSPLDATRGVYFLHRTLGAAVDPERRRRAGTRGRRKIPNAEGFRLSNGRSKPTRCQRSTARSGPFQSLTATELHSPPPKQISLRAGPVGPPFFETPARRANEAARL